MKRILYLIFTTLLIIHSCKMPKYADKTIAIYNNSKDTIAFFADERDFNPDCPSMFDDLPSNIHVVPIRPNGGVYFHYIDFPDEYFNNYPDKRMKIYLFNLDTLNRYSIKDINDSSNYLKRYDLSIHDLDSLNWTITYP